VLSGTTSLWPAKPGLSEQEWLQLASDEGSEAARGEVARLMVRQAETRRVLQSLAGVNLLVLPLKGSALACWAYPEPHLRSCVEVDLLLPNANTRSPRPGRWPALAT
jgi:hypothetical protein